MPSCESWAQTGRWSGWTGYDRGDSARAVSEHAVGPRTRQLVALRAAFHLVSVLARRCNAGVLPGRSGGYGVAAALSAAGLPGRHSLLAIHADAFGQHGNGA